MTALADAFADIALAISEALEGPFHSAIVHRQSAPVYDSGGSIIPGSTSTATCKAQVDAVTERQRLADGYTEKDQRILVLTSTLSGDLTTDMQIEFTDGPYVGRWMLASVDRDPVAAYYDCRGRKA